MKIQFLTNCYPPEIGGGPRLLLELAQVLSERGHSISVVTRFPRHLPQEMGLQKGRRWLIRETRPEAAVIRVNIPQLSRKIPLLREIEHILNFGFLVWASLLMEAPDVILVYSPPIVVGYSAIAVRFFRKSKVVLNVQDIFPRYLIELRVLKNKMLIFLAKLFEKSLYQRVDWISAISETNREIISKIAEDNEKISVIRNCVDTEFIVPGERNNEFRKEFDLGDKFILTFGGCIAEAHDMDIILNSARLLRKNEDILFLLAGNGPKYEDTILKAKEMKLKNIKIIPIQPFDKYVKMMAASDVGMVTLSPLLATPTPSKIKSIMSAGRPILASLPEGDAAKLIREAKCGMVVQAGNTRAFCEAVLKLYKNPQLCSEYGKSGRMYVVENLSSQASAKKYEQLFYKLLKGEK